ncbi:MAG TPA: glycine oxidase ThiO [Euzebya sp.]|nr:glycine oxidase ThiO [Euzebya sp.]
MQVDVVIVGGGVIGLSAAIRCADAGLSVTVLDPDPGRGASWAAAGLLAPVAELHYGEDALLRLNLASSALWAAWAAELRDRGVDVGYVACGSLMVARDADDAAELHRLMDTQQRLGLSVSWLRGRDARAAEPNLAPSTRGAVRVDGDHQVDNRALVEGLAHLAERIPTVTVRRHTVMRVDHEAGRVCGVTLADGTTVAGQTVVVAAGAGSGRIGGLGGLLPAIRPVKGQLLHLRSPAGPLARANLRGLEVYIVNRPDGRIVIGATVEERGFDTQVTAGGVHELLRAARELVPGIDECTFVEATAGLRPGSPDNAPVLGRVAEVQGLLLATGHYRNGVLLSPLTADAVAAWASGGTPPDAVIPFGPMRLDGALA